MHDNSLISDTVWNLRSGYKKNRAPIWRDLEERFLKSRSNRKEVNISKLSLVTSSDEVIVIPGKLLGSGEIGHKLTVSALSISENAAKKIKTAGGRIVSLNRLIEEYPEGKGVRIIG